MDNLKKILFYELIGGNADDPEPDIPPDEEKPSLDELNESLKIDSTTWTLAGAIISSTLVPALPDGNTIHQSIIYRPTDVLVAMSPLFTLKKGKYIIKNRGLILDGTTTAGITVDFKIVNLDGSELAVANRTSNLDTDQNYNYIYGLKSAVLIIDTDIDLENIRIVYQSKHPIGRGARIYLTSPLVYHYSEDVFMDLTLLNNYTNENNLNNYSDFENRSITKAQAISGLSEKMTKHFDLEAGNYKAIIKSRYNHSNDTPENNVSDSFVKICSMDENVVFAESILPKSNGIDSYTELYFDMVQAEENIKIQITHSFPNLTEEDSNTLYKAIVAEVVFENVV